LKKTDKKVVFGKNQEIYQNFSTLEMVLTLFGSQPLFGKSPAEIF
jgi:hypothetical protein